MIDSCENSNNRLLIVDWASLSYHQLFALVSKKKTSTYFDLDNPEAELYAWRSGMVREMLEYVKLFNPKDVLLTLEGKKVWRNNFVKEYYNENCNVYYDNTGYYVRFDNFLYKLFKEKDRIECSKLDVIKDIDEIPKKGKKLHELPERIQKILWDEILPKYKGNRKDQYWPFCIDKSVWKKYISTFASELSKVIRSYVVGCPDAEGDDIIYVTTQYWKDKYDSIVLVTGDSDLNQLLTQENLKIYNHKSREFVECANPKDYLEIKVLSGDKSDNINGMALPNKKTQLGPAGATKLYESAYNWYSNAKKEGWLDQYNRNKKLIDLSFIPTHIQRTICNLLDNSKDEIGEESDLYHLNITKKYIDKIDQYKNLGYYAVNTKERIKEEPDIFKPKMFENENENERTDFNNIETERKFDNVEDVFFDPTKSKNSEVDLF